MPEQRLHALSVLRAALAEASSPGRVLQHLRQQRSIDCLQVARALGGQHDRQPGLACAADEASQVARLVAQRSNFVDQEQRARAA